MSEAVIVGICSLTGVIVSNWFGHNKTLYRIEQLEKKQDKHNQVIERTYQIETDLSVINNEIENIKQDIDRVSKN